MDQKLTGYPSVDRPWLKYYENSVVQQTLKKCTIYQYIYDNNKNHLTDISLQYFNHRISYHSLFDSVEKCAKVLLEVGLKRGDCINLLTAGIPEAVYLVLACSRIGVLANFINPLLDPEQMKDRINDTDAEWIFVLDAIYQYADGILDQTCTKHVVIIPIYESFPQAVKTIAAVKSNPRKILRRKQNDQIPYMTWKSFISKELVYDRQIDDQYIENTPTVMVYSSGTTGVSKGIVHTNDSINATVQDSLSSGFFLDRTMTFLQMIPVWFSTGIVQSILLPLSVGVTVILEPRFSPEIFVKDVLKYQPTMTIAATSMWMPAIKMKEFHKADLSKMIYPFTGGEKLVPGSERELNRFLREHGCKSHVIKGYGMCELGGKVTDCTVANKEGSVGIPMSQIIVGIFDPITNEELPIGQHGEIRVDTPARMKEYFKNETATQEFFKEDSKGIRWGCTGDIGYMDEDGLLYVLGRKTDCFIDENGTIIYLFDIEEQIIRNENVSECKVVDTLIEGHTTLVAHIVLRDHTKDGSAVISQIHKELSRSLSENMIPYYYKIRTSMPVNKNGKRDIDALKQDTAGLIDPYGDPCRHGDA